MIILYSAVLALTACEMVLTEHRLSSCGFQAQQLRVSGSKAQGLLLLQCSGLVAPGMWDLGSPARDRTLIPCTARQILNHWTTSKVLQYIFYLFSNCRIIALQNVVSCQTST